VGISLSVSESLMKYPLILSMFILIMYILLRILGEKTSNSNYLFANRLATLGKLIIYGWLAWWIYSNTRGLDDIEVLTYFTFLLASVECAHNLAIFITSKS